MSYFISSDRLNRFSCNIGLPPLDWEVRKNGDNVTKVFLEFKEAYCISKKIIKTLNVFYSVTIVDSRNFLGFRVLIDNPIQFDAALTRYENLQKTQKERQEILENLNKKVKKLVDYLNSVSEEDLKKPVFFEPNFEYIVKLQNFPRNFFFRVGMIHLDDPKNKSKGLSLSESEVDELIGSV